MGEKLKKMIFLIMFILMVSFVNAETFSYCRNVTIPAFTGYNIYNKSFPISLTNLSNTERDGIAFIESPCLQNQNSTILSHETEYWNISANRAFIWVKIPVMYNATAKIIGLLYGGDNITQEVQRGAWDTNKYNAVWHLSNGSDSLQNADFPDISEALLQGIGKAVIPNALNFTYKDDSNYKMTQTHNDIFNLSNNTPYSDKPYTWEFYFRPNNDDLGAAWLFSKFGVNIGNSFIAQYNYEDRNIVYSLYQNNCVPSCITIQRMTPINTINITAFNHIAITYNGNNSAEGINIFINGVNVGGNTTTAGNFTYTQNVIGLNFSLGGLINDSSEGNRLAGIIDELRFSNSVLTQEEIMNDNLWKSLFAIKGNEQIGNYTINETLNETNETIPCGFISEVSCPLDVTIMHNSFYSCQNNKTFSGDCSLSYSINDSRFMINSATGKFNITPSIYDYNIPLCSEVLLYTYEAYSNNTYSNYQLLCINDTAPYFVESIPNMTGNLTLFYTGNYTDNENDAIIEMYTTNYDNSSFIVNFTINQTYKTFDLWATSAVNQSRILSLGLSDGKLNGDSNIFNITIIGYAIPTNNQTQTNYSFTADSSYAAMQITGGLYALTMIAALATRSFIFGSFAYFTGLILGFMLSAITGWLTIIMLLFNSLLFYKIFSRFR